MMVIVLLQFLLLGNDNFQDSHVMVQSIWEKGDTGYRPWAM